MKNMNNRKQDTPAIEFIHLVCVILNNTIVLQVVGFFAKFVHGFLQK